MQLTCMHFTIQRSFQLLNKLYAFQLLAAERDDPEGRQAWIQRTAPCHLQGAYEARAGAARSRACLI
jgi:hypothetical protein